MLRTAIRAALVAAVMLAGLPASAQVSKSTMQTNTATSFPDNVTGLITPATTRSYLNTLINSYQQYFGVNAQVGTTYTFVTTDYGQLVTFNNASPVAVTLPAPSATGFGTFNVAVRDIGAGTLTITPGGGATINGAATLTVSQAQFTWIVSDGTNYQIGPTPAAAVACASLPALTGDVTTSAGSCATTVAKIQGTTVSGATGTVNVVFSTSPTLITPTLGVAKATTLTAGDGCTTDRSGGSQIWVCRTLSASGNSHAFSSSDTITYTASSFGHATYDDETICTGSSGAINPNHCYSYQSFLTWSGAGTLSVLGLANFAPQVTAGTVSQVVFANCQDVAISGGATVSQYNCFNCPALSASTVSRCIFTAAQTPDELRGHIITHVIAPTLTSCGTNPAVSGSDTAGEVTMGTGNPTGCVISFTPGTYGAYNNPPFCTVTWKTNLATMQYVVTTASITLTQTATSSNKVDYVCIAQNGG